MAQQSALKIETVGLHRSNDVQQTLNDADKVFSFARTLDIPQPLSDLRRPLQFFVLSDLAAIVTGFSLSWLVAVVVNHFFIGRALGNELMGEQLAHTFNFAVIGTCLILWFNHQGHYRVRMPFWAAARQIVYATGFCILVDSFLQFATKQDLSRLWLVGGWLLAGGMIVTMRLVTRHMLQRSGLWQVRTLMIGNGATAEDARAAVESEQLGYNIVGQITDLDELRNEAQGSWKRLCNWYAADFLLVALDGPELQAAEDVLSDLTREHVPFAISPPLRGVPLLGMESQCFFNHDVMLLTRCNRLEEPLPRFIKRAFDIAVSGGVLLLLAPLFVLVAVRIMSDGGPAFYADRRIGVGGKVFGCLKFRSMIMNSRQALEDYLASNPEAAEEWKRDQKLRNDPRVTKIGAFIRKTSIDELPQLLNVLKGDMSLVGPRPINDREIPRYGRDASYYHSVRPGITGLWQVSGRNDVTYEKRVQLDRWYVRNWSLWNDISILCRTPAVLLFKKGAY